MKARLLSPVLNCQDPLYAVPYLPASSDAIGVQGLPPEVVLAIGFALYHSIESSDHEAETSWSNAARLDAISQRLSTGV